MSDMTYKDSHCVCVVVSLTTLILIGVVKVAGSASLESKGKSDGAVTCAFILNALAADSAPEVGCDILAEEANVVTCVVVDGLSKGASGHMDELSALLDPNYDLCLLAPYTD